MRRLIVPLILVFTACSNGPTAGKFGASDVEAIRKAAQDLAAAYNARDATKIVSLFSGAAVVMPPNTATLRGPDSIKGFYESRWAEGGTDLQIEARDIGGEGNLAYMSGTFSVVNRPPDGQERRDRGKFLWIARNLAGRWLFEYQMWSSDLPPATATP